MRHCVGPTAPVLNMARSQRRMPLLFTVGPFPPPVHGLAIVNRYVAESLSVYSTVQRFKVPGLNGASVAQRVRRLCALALTLVRVCHNLFRHRPDALVIGSSAGGVMLFDAATSLFATFARTRVYIYHHSFAYLNPSTTRWYHVVGLWLMRNRHHIVLCRCMAYALAQRHGVSPALITVVSNAAYILPTRPARSRLDTTMCLGFLSTVCRSKGIFEFFDLCERLRESGFEVTVEIAGPLDREIADHFHQRLAQLRHARYVGTLDEQGKEDFFQGIDLLVLPSRHIHEAEPLVVIESLSMGVPVVTTRRGCLPSVWADSISVHLVDESNFVQEACFVLAPWLASTAVRSEWAERARLIHADMHTVAKHQLAAMLQAVCA